MEATHLPGGAALVQGFVRLPAEIDAIPWLMSISGDGSVAWERRIITSDYVSVDALVAGDDGLVAMGGQAYVGATGVDAWVAALDSTGAEIWSRSLGSASIDGIDDLASTPGGGWVALGHTDGYGAGDLDVWVVKLDSAGQIEWQKTYGSTGPDSGTTVAVRAGGGYSFAGLLDGTPWLAALTADGSVEWERTYVPDGTVGSVGSVRSLGTDDGGHLVTATIAPLETLFTPRDLWALHVDVDGQVEACAVAQAQPSSAVAASDAIATDFPIAVETISTHSPIDDPMPTEAHDSYVDAQCGAGESTSWGTTGFLGSCSCPPGALCVGPTTGCGYDLTCVGRTNGATCSVRCGTNDTCPGSTCTIISVGETNLGAWCQ
jgi:hypothetical protein